VSSASAWCGVSGSRRLPFSFRPLVARVVAGALSAGFGVSAGCASGADRFARVAAGPACRVFRASSRSPSALVARSCRFVRSLAGAAGSVLAGFVVGPCPTGLRGVPARAWRSGSPASGSWSSLGLAAGLGVRVVVFWCGGGAAALPAAWGAWSLVAAGPFAGGWLLSPAAVQAPLF